MELTTQQELLFEFVKLKHGDQKRKYTNEPYHTHLFSVAKIVSQYEENCIEIALCHDLFEDTNCTFNELYKEMMSISYSGRFSYMVCTCVQELTDKYTSKDYPYLKRAIRKKNECERLSNISYRSMSVKYADLIDNTSSIVEHDKNFARIYLSEKENILAVMVKGNPELFEICKSVLVKSKEQLSE